MQFQFFNTFSNIAILFAVYFAHRLIKKERVQTFSIKVLPVFVAFMGLGSFAWHGLPHPLTNLLDTIPIFFFAGFVLYFLLTKLINRKPFIVSLMFGVGLTAFLLAYYDAFFKGAWNGLEPYVFILLVIGTVFLGLLRRYGKVMFQGFLPLGFFVVALAFRIIDFPLCNLITLYDHAVGTHFLWHTFVGIAFYATTRFLIRVEQTTNKGETKLRPFGAEQWRSHAV